MDHDTAVRLMAAEGHVLGILSASERDEFEEHLADCSRCLEDLGLAAAFVANAKAVFRDQRSQADRAHSIRWPVWLRWRPIPTLAWSVGLNLILCAGLGYQLLQVRQAARLGAPRTVEIVPVHGVVRGSEAQTAIVANGPSIVFSFDLPRRYQRYSYFLQPLAGGATLTGEAGPSASAESLNLEVPLARLAPGEYTVAAIGWDGSRQNNLGECRFEVPPHSSNPGGNPRRERE